MPEVLHFLSRLASIDCADAAKNVSRRGKQQAAREGKRNLRDVSAANLVSARHVLKSVTVRNSVALDTLTRGRAVPSQHPVPLPLRERWDAPLQHLAAMPAPNFPGNRRSANRPSRVPRPAGSHSGQSEHWNLSSCTSALSSV